ncbi:MAG: hypothetical protein ACPG88_07935 [Porticoccaceae bacterium]|jgi:hypothetical protein
MISAIGLWSAVALIYAIFWVWYVGLKGKLSETEVEHYMRRIEESGLASDKAAILRRFLAEDDGREWFMINLLDLKSPKRESAKLLQSYSKIFMAGMFKSAGHPFFIANAQAKNIENLHCDQADNWTIAGIVRYRSRRDCVETFLATFGSDHHADKLAALEKTLAFPATTSLLMGSPRVLVALVLALIAAITQILFL